METYTPNKKETTEISGIYNEDGRLGAFDTHRAFREQWTRERQ